MTYYLKHRPQNLKDLDQDSVRISLENIVKSGNIPHAFLFSGPKGTGKTSAARIIAKIVNCEKLDLTASHKSPVTNIEPCNKCSQCLSITKGQNIDVIELDAASHRGIEDIRQIRDAVKLAPALANKKIYIIDEAHMLTTEASNALLKTLEEPPAHVMFILATTNPEKLIDTIRSRATNISFKKASILETVKSLSKIVKKESVKIDEGSLELIAKSSDGSFRDAAKILEQITSEIKVITPEAVENMLTAQRAFEVDNFIKFLETKNTKGSLLLIERAVQKGASAKDLTRIIIERLRGLLLSKIDLNDERSDFKKESLIVLIKLFMDAYSKFSYTYLEQIPLEIAVVEYCSGTSLTANKDSDSEVESGGDEINSIKIKEKLGQKSDTFDNSEKDPVDNKPDIKHDHIEASGKVDINADCNPIKEEIWMQILSKMRPDHTSTEALLRAARPIEYDGSVLKLGVYYKFHKEHLESNQHRIILEDILTSFLGNNIKVVCVLTDPPISTKRNTKNADSIGVNGDTVLLAEPDESTVISSSALTGSEDGDIIKIAEKIFSG